MPFLPPNQQRQSTEGTSTEGTAETKVLNFNSETKVSDFGLRLKFENLVSANLFCSVL